MGLFTTASSGTEAKGAWESGEWDTESGAAVGTGNGLHGKKTVATADMSGLPEPRGLDECGGNQDSAIRKGVTEGGPSYHTKLLPAGLSSSRSVVAPVGGVWWDLRWEVELETFQALPHRDALIESWEIHHSASPVLVWHLEGWRRGCGRAHMLRGPLPVT